MSKLVDAIENATLDDLNAIDNEIATIETEIADFVLARRSRLDALKAIRKVIDIRLNGKPPYHKTSRPDEPVKAGEDANDSGDSGNIPGASKLQIAIYDLLFSEGGAMPMPAIAARLKRTPAAIRACVTKSDWFTTGDGQVKIARSGRED